MRGAGAMTRRGGSLEERLWRRVVKSDDPDGCWLWTGPKDYGYGRIMHNYRNRSTHRVAYELLVGPIPAGLQIDHLCRTPACVNPAHMELVTRRENILRSDGLTARLARRGECANGHKFTPATTRYRGGTRICVACRTQFKRSPNGRSRADAGARVRAVVFGGWHRWLR